MTFDKKAFGTKLAELRKQAGLTQLVAARMLNVTDKAVSKWEKGGSFPSIETLLRISDLYQVSLAELFEAAQVSNQRVMSIVLTGGPCAGKSQAISWITGDMQRKRWKVIDVPGVAAELMDAGIDHVSCGGNLSFQRHIMRMQLAREQEYRKVAESLPTSNVLLVFNQGIMDGKARLRKVEFQGLLREFGLTEVQARDRYDAVFHLVSTAKDAPDLYKVPSGNPTKESPESAAALDNKIIRAWTGHPRLRVIDNAGGFEDKFRRLVAGVSDITGTPGPRKLQRKYLVQMPNLAMLESLPTSAKVETVQTYLKSDPDLEVRIRRRGSEGDYLYTKTIKEQAKPGVELRRILNEERLTEGQYLAELANVDPSLAPVRKTRYCLCEDDRCVQLDVFPFWEDQAVLELPIADKDEQPTIPKMFKVIKEITGDPAFRNYNLAKTIAKDQ